MLFPNTLRRAALSLAVATISAAALPAQAQSPRPRLTVVIVVDQMRADYLDRFGSLFLPPGKSGRDAGGFRFLRERGASFEDARYRHFPLFTGPGHAVVLTGGYPYKTGIIGNDWYSKATKSGVYCVSDPNAKVIGATPNSKAKPMSPANFQSSTVGDEMKEANAAAKVVTLSLKDRAAILLGGRRSDASIWFDDSTGNWISSDAYCKNGQLPAWVASVNARRVPDKSFGRSWSAEFVPASTWKTPSADFATPPKGFGSTFVHKIDGGLTSPGASFYKSFTLTPWANDFVLETAAQAVVANKMGADDVPDLLALNLATNDYVGHAFGPDSPEVREITAATDRSLSRFFRALEANVPGGLSNVTIALTADHGVAPIPEISHDDGFQSGRIGEESIEAAADKALDAKFGARDWVSAYVEPYLYLNDAAVADSKRDIAEVQAVAARAIGQMPGVYAAYTRTQIEEGRLPATEMGARLYKGFYPKRAGDVLMVAEQAWFSEGSPHSHASTHGSPYTYDTHVPLMILGRGIKPGKYFQNVCPADLAPTLCAQIGVAQPSACDGTILPALAN
jgi:predicted AlkP superfamily pyrophosphatase or phosphodiesterase